jgi:hypothetical protein
MKNVHIPETHRLHYILFLRFYVYFLYTLQDPEYSWNRINADRETKTMAKTKLLSDDKPLS